MPVQLKEDEFKLLKLYVEQECGISVTDEKRYLFESRLLELVNQYNCASFGEFYLKAKNSSDKTLKNQIIDAITTHETLWFRDEMPFSILKNYIFPDYIREIREGHRQGVKIWSAACSTGQEPYSIAITVMETPGRDILQGRVSILASDISHSSVQSAQAARYNSIAISRGLSQHQRETYFLEEGRTYLLKPEIQRMVQFQQLNLQNSLNSVGKFDIVFLRNVAIYFSHEFKVELLKKLYKALNPGGYLFLGITEHVQAYNQDFILKQFGRGFCYQRPNNSAISTS